MTTFTNTVKTFTKRNLSNSEMGQAAMLIRLKGDVKAQLDDDNRLQYDRSAIDAEFHPLLDKYLMDLAPNGTILVTDGEVAWSKESTLAEVVTQLCNQRQEADAKAKAEKRDGLKDRARHLVVGGAVVGAVGVLAVAGLFSLISGNRR